MEIEQEQENLEIERRGFRKAKTKVRDERAEKKRLREMKKKKKGSEKEGRLGKKRTRKEGGSWRLRFWARESKRGRLKI